ncbi:unnamed protein product [Penicillium pancosmium]
MNKIALQSRRSTGNKSGEQIIHAITWAATNTRHIGPSSACSGYEDIAICLGCFVEDRRRAGVYSMVLPEWH